MKKNVLVILAEGFEEIEALTPVDLLRRADIKTTIAAQGENKFVIGKTGIQVVASRLLKDCMDREYDLVFLPGGPGVRHLCEDEMVLNKIRQQNERGGYLAAICAAPLVLEKAGLIPEPFSEVTGHFSIRDKLAVPLQDQAVVTSGNLITSQGAGTAVPFGLTLIATLLGEEKAAEIAKAIMAPASHS